MVDSSGLSRQPLTSGGSSTPPDDLIEVARISGAHGVRGWVKLQPFSADSTVLGSVKRWWIGSPTSPLERSMEDSQGDKPPKGILWSINVVWAKAHGALWLACIKGLVDRDQAHELKGSSVWVSRSEFPDLDPDEFYWVDLIGNEVFRIDSDEDTCSDIDERSNHSTPGSNGRFGVVESIIDNPAHPLLSVLRQQPDSHGQWVDMLNAKGKPTYSLIPFVSAHVISVDVELKRIVVDWPEDF